MVTREPWTAPRSCSARRSSGTQRQGVSSGSVSASTRTIHRTETHAPRHTPVVHTCEHPAPLRHVGTNDGYPWTRCARATTAQRDESVTPLCARMGHCTTFSSQTQTNRGAVCRQRPPKDVHGPRSHRVTAGAALRSTLNIHHCHKIIVTSHTRFQHHNE